MADLRAGRHYLGFMQVEISIIVTGSASVYSGARKVGDGGEEACTLTTFTTIPSRIFRASHVRERKEAPTVFVTNPTAFGGDLSRSMALT